MTKQPESTTIIDCTIKGISPLLQHRFPNEENPEGKVKKKKKVYNAQEDAEKALYLNEKGKVCQPAIHIERAMAKAAVQITLEGRKTYKDVINGGVYIYPELVPHKNQKWEIDRRPEVVQRARIMRARPILKEWELEFELHIVDDRAQIESIQEILRLAGLYNGLGDRRPRYGRFEVTRFKKRK